MHIDLVGRLAGIGLFAACAVWGAPAAAARVDAGPGQPVPSRHALAEAQLGSWHVTITASTAATGFEEAALEARRGAEVVHVALSEAPVWRVARTVSGLRLHAATDRVLVFTDRQEDVSGLIVVDLRRAALVTSLKGRHLTVSPDARYVAFEEYFSRLDADWPWNETVYAVLDVTASGDESTRPCPDDDDRCRGRVVYLPSRQATCAAFRERTDHSSCLVPGRAPQHERRSPFVWLDASTLAFVSADRVRETFALVEVRLATNVRLTANAAGPGADVAAYVCGPEAREEGGDRCPQVRQTWSVDAIRRDDAGGRLWIHFRDRLPEVPGGWLAVP